MPRKRTKKKAAVNRARKRGFTIFSFRILSIVGVLIIVVVASQLVDAAKKNPNVLGTSYLAKGGDDGGSSGSGRSGSSDESKSSGSGSSDSGSSSDRSGSGSGSSGSSGSGSSGSSGSDAQQTTSLKTEPTRIETRSETGVRTRTDTKTDETRTEIRLSVDERIRTRTKDGETRIDITSGGVKTRLEYRDDRVVIKAEQEDGSEVELEDDTILKIDERLAKNNIKIATVSGERFVLSRGNAGAVTDFPLSIDLATNTLVVNTPAGEKAVTVLPDQAVQNLIAANIVHTVGVSSVIDKIQSGSLTSVGQLVQLTLRNGVPVYEIQGVSNQRLLGFIPVDIQKTVTVSVETGAVGSVEESPFQQVLDFFSL